MSLPIKKIINNTVENATDRFWRKVKKTKKCWLWTSATTSNGYGIFYIYPEKYGSPVRAHRYSYEIHFGPIKKGKLICHKCDVRNCVKPDHLYEGTYFDNNRDTVKRGRHKSPYKNRTHCSSGHEYNIKNTYYSKRQRICRICKNINRTIIRKKLKLSKLSKFS